MPHVALQMLGANCSTLDPSFLAERSGQFARARSVSDLAQIVGLPRDAATDIDSFLPTAVRNALVGAYRAASESGTDALIITWEEAAGFSVSVAHAPGTDATTDRGIISVTVRSPRLRASSRRAP